MDQQIILSCDEDGNFLEYIPKETGHTGEGRRHLAITVLLYRRKLTRSPYNSQGQVLLQRRKHKIFDNVWDFTASTHPLHKTDGTDETVEEATLRALKDEYDIQNIILKRIGEFNYFAKVPEQKRREATHFAKIDNLCENEHCFLLVGKYNGAVQMRPAVGYEYKWMDKGEFLKDVSVNPQQYAPWVIEGVKILKQMFF